MSTENEPIPGATTALYARIAELELELQRSHASARGLDDRLGEQNAKLTQALIELRDMRERAERAESAQAHCSKNHVHVSSLDAVARESALHRQDRDATRHAADVASQAHAEAVARADHLERVLAGEHEHLVIITADRDRLAAEVERLRGVLREWCAQLRKESTAAGVGHHIAAEIERRFLSDAALTPVRGGAEK